MGDFDGLVGRWRLVEAGGPVGSTAVQLFVNPTPGWFWLEVAFEDGGLLSGVWRASRTGEFLAGVSGGRGPSSQRHDDTLRTSLNAAVGFTHEGSDLILRDRHGDHVARLTRSSTPSPVRSSWEPNLTSYGLGRHVPDVPSGLTPATHGQLLGAWRPILPGPDRLPWQNIEFRDDGWWHAFPRGNITRGRWIAGPGGTLLAVHPYAKTLAFAGIAEVDRWLLGVARAGFNNEDVLVLLDDDGHEVQRLERTEQASTNATSPPERR